MRPSGSIFVVLILHVCADFISPVSSNVTSRYHGEFINSQNFHQIVPSKFSPWLMMRPIAFRGWGFLQFGFYVGNKKSLMFPVHPPSRKTIQHQSFCYRILIRCLKLPWISKFPWDVHRMLKKDIHYFMRPLERRAKFWRIQVRKISIGHTRVGPIYVHHCGLVVSAPAWDGTGCEFDSWQCRIYIPCSLSLRLLGSLQGSLGWHKNCVKKSVKNVLNSLCGLKLLG